MADKFDRFIEQVGQLSSLAGKRVVKSKFIGHLKDQTELPLSERGGKTAQEADIQKELDAMQAGGSVDKDKVDDVANRMVDQMIGRILRK